MRKNQRLFLMWSKPARRMAILRDPLLQDEASPVATHPPSSGHGTNASVPAPVKSADDGARSELQRKRDTLAEQVTEMHWDLGGLAYEMAIRDHFRLDVLVRRAAVLQERDAELAEVERLLRMEHDGVAGSCPNCAAPHSRGALYCWQCGTTLMERRPSDVVSKGEDATSVMDALLVQHGGPAAERPVSADE
jgi:hypothetical protein